MAAFVRLLLVLIICWIRPCCSQKQYPTITINPPEVKLTPNATTRGTRVTITCTAPSIIPYLKGLSISKDDSDSLLRTRPDGSADLGPSMNGKNVTKAGSIDENYIALTLNQAKCEDDGTYICSLTYQEDGGDFKFVTTEADKKLRTEVSAGQLTMTMNQPFTPVWKVNATLTLTCEGPMGSVNTTSKPSDPQINWVWEYQNHGEGRPSRINGPGWEIKVDLFGNSKCYKTQKSTLTRRLTLEDSGRTYRCFVRRGFTDLEQFAASRLVGTVTPTGEVSDIDRPSEPTRANVGAIVGGTFGALIVIAVVIIIVYFLVIRPRRRKQAEENVDGHEKDDKEFDGEAVPPYTSEPSNPPDPSVLYSQPKKRRGKDKRWDDRDREAGARTAEGLHYADLDLMRNPPRDPPARGNPAPARGNPAPSTPTEYASIRLY